MMLRGGKEGHGRPAVRAAFSATERGGDGLHYFLLHEPARSRAFLWVKDKF